MRSESAQNAEKVRPTATWVRAVQGCSACAGKGKVNVEFWASTCCRSAVGFESMTGMPYCTTCQRDVDLPAHSDGEVRG